LGALSARNHRQDAARSGNAREGNFMTETTQSRFAAFNVAEAGLIADGLEILQPDSDEARDMASDLHREADAHRIRLDEARIAEEQRRAAYQERHEAEARQLLQANGFAEEMAGGGCLLLARHFPRGAYVWATCYEGGGLPEPGDYTFGVYHRAVDDGCDSLFTLSYQREHAKDGPCFVDALRQALAAAAALDSTVGAPPLPGCIPEPADVAADAAALVAERVALCPPPFEPWSDGIAQSFSVYRDGYSGAVILSDMFGQEPATAESWEVSIFTGRFVFDDDDDAEELSKRDKLTPVLRIGMAEGLTVDAAIAAGLAMVAALPRVPEPAEPCDGHRDTGRGVCAYCQQPMPESR
jgi:hypothetical protein